MFCMNLCLYALHEQRFVVVIINIIIIMLYVVEYRLI